MPGCGPSVARRLDCSATYSSFSQQNRVPAAGLLGGHGLGNVHPHLAKSARPVEAVRRSLNLGGAYEHLAEAEGACLIFRALPPN